MTKADWIKYHSEELFEGLIHAGKYQREEKKKPFGWCCESDDEYSVSESGCDCIGCE